MEEKIEVTITISKEDLAKVAEDCPFFNTLNHRQKQEFLKGYLRAMVWKHFYGMKK
jgi:hypothetical protein